MPFVNIQIVKQAIAADPEGKKAEISAKVAEVISGVTGLAQDQVWIVYEEVDAKDWFLGPDSVKKLRFTK
jgi:4-oxalocrotonate tautomerase